MNRKESLEKFKIDHQEESQILIQEFWSRLNEHTEEILTRIYAAFEDICRQAEETEKTHVTYFNFSLMRCDLLKKRAIIRLDAMSVEWYLDDAPLTSSFDLDFLFEPFFRREERLLLDMRPYRGKVNSYDVTHMIQDEIFVCNQLITHLLRFSLRNIETFEAFTGIPKLLFWSIRWGEYKDYTEIALQVNREEQSPERWQEKLKDLEAEKSERQAAAAAVPATSQDGKEETVPSTEVAADSAENQTAEEAAMSDSQDVDEEAAADSPAPQSETSLAFGYWYNIPLEGGDLSGKALYFTTFEGCTLNGIDFSNADLSGARFLNCRIEDCEFSGAVLDRSEWNGCSFGENQFQDASFKQAFFSREGFAPELFTDEQIEDMLTEVEAV